MSAIIAPTTLPSTATNTAGVPAPVVVTTAPPIVGYNPSVDRLADYSTAFQGMNAIPVMLTPTPAPGRKSLSALEILLISTAVAVGAVTLCLLISVRK